MPVVIASYVKFLLWKRNVIYETETLLSIIIGGEKKRRKSKLKREKLKRERTKERKICIYEEESRKLILYTQIRLINVF